VTRRTQDLTDIRLDLECPTASVAIVHLRGEHDLATHESLKRVLASATSRRRHLLVDLSQCAFISSTVITLLLHAQGEVVSDGGEFAVIVPDTLGPIRRIADVMQLDQLFPLLPECPQLDEWPVRVGMARPFRAAGLQAPRRHVALSANAGGAERV
jgi:anti-anti-sigma factor